MILDLVLWSGVFGSGCVVFKRQEKLFERRVLKDQGHGVLLVALAGPIELQPGIREIRILSGNRERPTRSLAEKLGMDAHDAQVSVSLQGASQLATDTAQIVLMNKGIRQLPRLFDLSASFKRHMNEQFMLILTPSLLGAGVILLSGWGMVYIMYMSMAALGASLGNAMLERPPPQGPSVAASPAHRNPRAGAGCTLRRQDTAVHSGPERTRHAPLPPIKNPSRHRHAS